MHATMFITDYVSIGRSSQHAHTNFPCRQKYTCVTLLSATPRLECPRIDPYTGIHTSTIMRARSNIFVRISTDGTWSLSSGNLLTMARRRRPLWPSALTQINTHTARSRFLCCALRVLRQVKYGQKGGPERKRGASSAIVVYGVGWLKRPPPSIRSLSPPPPRPMLMPNEIYTHMINHIHSSTIFQLVEPYFRTAQELIKNTHPICARKMRVWLICVISSHKRGVSCLHTPTHTQPPTCHRLLIATPEIIYVNRMVYDCWWLCEVMVCVWYVIHSICIIYFYFNPYMYSHGGAYIDIAPRSLS